MFGIVYRILTYFNQTWSALVELFCIEILIFFRERSRLFRKLRLSCSFFPKYHSVSHYLTCSLKQAIQPSLIHNESCHSSSTIFFPSPTHRPFQSVSVNFCSSCLLITAPFVSCRLSENYIFLQDVNL